MRAAEVWLRDVEVDGRRAQDVVLRDGVITAVGDAASASPAAAGVMVIDGHGGALVPGLHDHHLHLFATAAQRSSTAVGPPAVTDATTFTAALRDRARLESDAGWIRAVGWDDATVGWLDRDALDEAVPDRPVKVQHRSGALWVLNSAGLAELQLDGRGELPGGVERGDDGRLTGRMFHVDRWLRDRTGATPPDLGPVSHYLATRGVTGVTDATAHNGAAELQALAAARRSGAVVQHVTAMTRPDVTVPAEVDGAVGIGPVKLVLAERSLPPFAELVGSIASAHDRGRAVAIHAASRATVVLAVAALADAGAGPGDRLEHASVVPPEVARQIAALGVTVVTQPHFIAERGDHYLQEVEAEDQPWLYRGRGLLDAGIPLAAGSDAPVGGMDPWASMRAAVERRTATGRVLGPDEGLTSEQARASYIGPADQPGRCLRSVRVGEPADLCLLNEPWATVSGALADVAVRMTIVAGTIVFDSDERGQSAG